MQLSTENESACDGGFIEKLQDGVAVLLLQDSL
jgi:hypothetical protein